ncbi:hypothetical protein CEV08_03540 [Bartonella tribocorum]|uniref:Uncharacterized protein n=1 Tax=Bartonella tribocorum TaxID=85701 RepID=A0A2M6UWH8_9HYPH|nr:hypothetical protein CEV08_03540 [Bartonella tribocorum]
METKLWGRNKIAFYKAGELSQTFWAGNAHEGLAFFHKCKDGMYNRFYIMLYVIYGGEVLWLFFINMPL